MSGSSYEYLYFNSVSDMLTKYGALEQLERMCKRLEGLSYAKLAAAKSRRVQDRLTKLEASIQKNLDDLHDVWRAVEWWDSGDWGEGEVKRAIEKMRLRKKEKHD